MNEPPISDDELPDAEQPDAMVYALAAAPGFRAARAGQAIAGLARGLKRTEDGGQCWREALADLELPQPGPVTAVAVSPDFDHDRLVVAGVPGGVLRSTDGGQHWKTVNFPPPFLTISALVISPSFGQDGTLLAGSIENGVFVSQDAGEHWVSWNFGLLDMNILCLAMSPNFANDETLLAGTESGLFRSTNGGRAWREVELPFGFDVVTSLAFPLGHPDDSPLYIGTENHGMWVSPDAVEQWRQVAENQVIDPVNTPLIAGNTLLTVTANTLWRSTDRGLTWASRSFEEVGEAVISAALAPEGLGAQKSLLVGFSDGEIRIMKWR